MSKAVANYRQAVGLLSDTAKGAYAGPSRSAESLERALAHTRGMKPEAIRSFAAGKTSVPSRGKVIPVVVGALVRKFAWDLFMGLLSAGLWSIIDQFLRGKSDADCLCAETNRAVDAVEDIDRTCSEQCDNVAGDLLEQVVKCCDVIQQYHQVSTAEGTSAINPHTLRMVDLASQAIEAGADALMGIVQERDSSLRSCYDCLCGSATSVVAGGDRPAAGPVPVGENPWCLPCVPIGPGDGECAVPTSVAGPLPTMPVAAVPPLTGVSVLGDTLAQGEGVARWGIDEALTPAGSNALAAKFDTPQPGDIEQELQPVIDERPEFAEAGAGSSAPGIDTAAGLTLAVLGAAALVHFLESELRRVVGEYFTHLGGGDIPADIPSEPVSEPSPPHEGEVVRDAAMPGPTESRTTADEEQPQAPPKPSSEAVPPRSHHTPAPTPRPVAASVVGPPPGATEGRTAVRKAGTW